MKPSITLAVFSVLTILAPAASADHYDYSHRDQYDRSVDRAQWRLPDYGGRGDYSYSRRSLSDDFLRRDYFSNDRYDNVQYDHGRCNSGYNRDRWLSNGHTRNRFDLNRDRYRNDRYRRRSGGCGGLLGILTGRGLGINGYYNR